MKTSQVFYNVAAVIFGLGIGILFWWLIHKEPVVDNSKELAVVARMQFQIRQHQSHDSIWSRITNRLRDSIRIQDTRVEYWRNRYRQPIIVTQPMIRDVFKQDSSTIVGEVVRGEICDSLQSVQQSEIKTLKETVTASDSVNVIRGEQIAALVRIDSVHQDQTKRERANVHRVKKRAVVVVGVAILAVVLSLLRGN